MEFDWLFVNEHAETFMKCVEKSKNMELFKLLLIRCIVLFKWQFYRRSIIR